MRLPIRLARPSRRTGLPVLVLLAAAATPAAADASGRLGCEVSVARHLQDGEEQELRPVELLEHGRLLFEAAWTDQEGGGQPLSKGTGAPLADPGSPLSLLRGFNRISGPDANSCAGCHAQPFGIAGGGGDFVADVVVLGQRFDFVTFDTDEPTPTRGCADEAGTPVTLERIANGRATLGMFGSGLIERVGRMKAISPSGRGARSPSRGDGRPRSRTVAVGRGGTRRTGEQTPPRGDRTRRRTDTRVAPTERTGPTRRLAEERGASAPPPTDGGDGGPRRRPRCKRRPGNAAS